MEQDLRKKAITLYLKGESPKSIYTDLNRSKSWLFKWLKRYQTGDPDWYKDKPRAPKNPFKWTVKPNRGIRAARAWRARLSGGHQQFQLNSGKAARI